MKSVFNSIIPFEINLVLKEFFWKQGVLTFSHVVGNCISRSFIYNTKDILFQQSELVYYLLLSLEEVYTLRKAVICIISPSKKSPALYVKPLFRISDSILLIVTQLPRKNSTWTNFNSFKKSKDATFRSSKKIFSSSFY